MISLQITDYKTILAFWLVFSRFIGLFMQLPIFDNVSVPTMVKILTCLILTYAFFPFLKPEIMKDVLYMGEDNFWMLTIFHTFVGLIIGFFVKSIMHIYTSSGSIITQQVGFGAVRYFDPTSGQQVGPFEKLIHWTVLIMVISSGALLPMFKGALASFEAIHIYNWGNFANGAHFFLDMFKSIFLSAIMLASPLIFTNILVMTILGIIARMVPQMNVIMVSFVLNIGLGLLVFTTSSEEFFRVAFRVYTEKLGEWFQFII